MTSLRYPAVAGMFYPGDRAQLDRAISEYLGRAPRPPTAAAPKAMIVPHAGYVYSGPVAASAYAALGPARDRIRRVVLLGPAHRAYVRGAAASSAAAFATPLGKVPLNQALIRETVEAFPFVHYQDDAHLEEHSLEVQLPFLQTMLGDFELLPYAVGDARPEEIAALLDTLWDGEETLIVISSDLSHYLDYRSAQQIDRVTTDAIERLEPERIGLDQACGAIPVRGLLSVARKRGLVEKTVDLRNSGDTAGPRNSVVGYGAYLFYEPNGESNDAERPAAH